MFRFVSAVALVLALAAMSSAAVADSFDFYGADAGGVGSASMDVTIDGKVLTAIVTNTSPILQLDGVSQNNPAIVAFGFDLGPDDLGLLAWDLEAFTAGGSAITIGSSSGVGSWGMTDVVNGTRLDYIADGAVDGGLYNPLLAGTLGNFEGSKANYYTAATLTMTFDAAPSLDFWIDPNGKDGSPWVRMQRVGAGGSLKLPAQDPNPEPATVALLGLGLVGLGIRARRRSRA